MKQNGHAPRVVVTGIGAITPLGHSWPETWAALKAGTSAGRRITHFDPTDYPTQFACSVVDFDPSKYMDFKEAKRLGAVTHFAWAAIQEARTEIAKLPNLFAETSQLDGVGSIESLVEAGLTPKILFGTHSPFFIPLAGLARVLNDLEDGTAYNILGGNAQKLLKK